jgi:signal transduction histidine kinase
LSRLGRQALTVQDVDVAALVRGVVDELQPQRPRALSLRVDGLPWVAADPALLRQVFVNLLSNAFKFTRHVEHPVVHVGGDRGEHAWVFFVRDNGPGFDMAQAGHLFDAFHRLHRPDEFEGSGVGLSIVKRIVQRHGGRVWAEASPGQGASFFFTLEAAREPLSPVGAGLE